MNRITKSRHPPTKPLVGGKYIDPAKWGSFVRMRVSSMQFILGVTRHIFRTMLPGRKNSTQWNSISLFLGNHIWLQSMDGLWFAMTACPGPPGIICLKRHRHRNDNRKWLKGGKNLSPWCHSNLEGGSPFANRGIFIQVPQKNARASGNSVQKCIWSGAIVWKDSFSQSFWLHFPSCLRSVHRWWAHLHGAARRGRSWTKMHMNRISSLEEWKESHISKLFSNQVMLLKQDNKWWFSITVNCEQVLIADEKKHYRAWRGILWHLLTLFGSSLFMRDWNPVLVVRQQAPSASKSENNEDKNEKKQLYKTLSQLESPSVFSFSSYSWWKGSLP